MNDVDASATVSAHLGSDDFELEEFAEGWRVIRPLGEDMMGAATYVVERATGSLREFASSVPPHRIAEHYERLRLKSRVVDEGYQ